MLFALGLSWPAPLLGVWFPTTRVLVSQALRVLFFAAPGVVALAEVSDDVRRWLVLNPLTGLFESFRHVFLYADAPQAEQLLYPGAFGLALCALFMPLYAREQRHIAKLVRS